MSLRWEASGVLRAAISSPSSVLTTTISPDGQDGALKPLPGQKVTFEPEVVFAGNTCFLETGLITFGSRHRLHFTAIGWDFLGPSPDLALKQGSVMWRVEGGEGQFTHPSRPITSNLSVGDAGAMTDHLFGEPLVL